MTNDEEIRKARERISKLLNMTVERGATEDEQANAMRLAAGIATRLGIDLAQIQAATGEKPKPKIAQKYTSMAMKPYEAFCAEAAGVLYGVICVAPNLGKNGFYYTGREENIELAQQTMLWLVRQVELLYKQNLPRGLSKRDRADFRNSFKDMCARRVLQRAYDLVRNMKTQDQAAQEATGRNALVVAGYFDGLRREIDDWYDESAKATQARIAANTQAREERRIAQLAAMSEPERVAFLEREQAEKDAIEREERKRQKAYERRIERNGYREPRRRSMRIGSGTDAGRKAGDHVRLRKEIE